MAETGEGEGSCSPLHSKTHVEDFCVKSIISFVYKLLLRPNPDRDKSTAQGS